MSTIQDIQSAFKKISQGVERSRKMSLIKKAKPYRDRGWNDLAEVIEKEEGRRIVRDGMSDILDWIGR